MPHGPGIFQSIDSIDVNAAAIRCQQGGQNPKRCGFAGSVRTQQSIQTGFGHIEIKPVESSDVPVGLAELTEFDQRHRFTHTDQNLGRAPRDEQRPQAQHHLMVKS
ncbi:MAG: Uncharacterised protein [Synechococcus sp. CC9902]|nr:MAG: Uncharacterised protein [Synechococcus sp. CC9902]